MIYYKTESEIEKIRQSNLLVSKTLAEVCKHVEPGVTTATLDKIAEEYIRDNGGEPAFLGYRGFPKSLCTSINSVVVHGIPSDEVLMDGDIVSVDCGVLMNGFYGDTAFTFPVGEVKKEIMDLLLSTRESLYLAIEKIVPGNRIGDISYMIQSHNESRNYSVVRELVGHGIGKNLHEEPEVPNYGRRGNGPKLKKGLVICIEPMINLGTKNVRQENDGWTIRTRDNQPSAHYELAVAVDDEGADVLSSFEYIENVLREKNPGSELIKKGRQNG